MKTLLTIEHMSVKIGDATPVRDVNLTLDRGRILGVTGASGSGKSMTAFAVMGLLPDKAKISGTLTFDNVPYDPLDDVKMATRRSRDIGFIFQEPMTALNPLMRIGDQVAELFHRHRAMSWRSARIAARQILDRVGLDGIPQKRYPHQISGGQRQRVAIAMAIALKPKLLLADEPTTALDTTTQRDILELLVRLVREDGMAMMFITHDLALMARYADDLVVMHKGKVETQGPVSMMLNPKNEILKDLVDASLLGQCDRKIITNAPVLSLNHITKSYDKAAWFTQAKPHVDDVSFTLHRGMMTGLVGRSGCGKSTLSKIALALSRADDGEVIFEGNPITPSHIPKPVRPRLSAVFQDPYGSFNPRQTIAELVAEPLWREPADAAIQSTHDRVVAALKAVGIPEKYLDRNIQQCSGGERQRIAFARAMITKPDVIILDEPVSALDAPYRGQVMAEIAALSQAHKIATLFISHDLSVVRSFCPYVMVMADGAIVENGPTETIFSQPKHPETRRLINAMPDLGEALDMIDILENTPTNNAHRN